LIPAAADHHQEIHHIANKLYCLSALSSNNFNLTTSPTELGFCKKFEGNKPSSKDGKTLFINSDLSNERRGI
jgi:hypothetical protein